MVQDLVDSCVHSRGMRSALGSSKDGSKSRVPPVLCRARGVPLQQVDRQVGVPLSAGEQRRAAALHKLAAVRNFAHQDCEPCCVMDGLFVGVRPSQHPAACQCLARARQNAPSTLQ